MHVDIFVNNMYKTYKIVTSDALIFFFSLQEREGDLGANERSSLAF